MENEDVRDKGGVYFGGLLFFVTLSLFVFCGIAAAVVGDIDMNGDVDWFDMDLLTDDWLAAGGISDIDDDNTVNLIDYSLLSGNWLCTNLTIADTPNDLDNIHPHLWCRGYGPDNGLWLKAQTTHAEIWQRLSDTARTGSWGGLSRTNGQELMRSAMAFVISKNPGFGNHCQSAVRALNGHYFTFTDPEMEPFYAYCLAYDAIVDDPCTTWLTPSEKAAALATMANVVSRLDDGGGGKRSQPTHNYMVLHAAMHAAGLYNLRGEPGYESIFNTARNYCLIYHNERVNGLCSAPLTNNGPRPIDGFPYEGPQYGAYQASRSLIHRHILEMNEYPNPPTVPDENQSGFFQNYNLAWMAVALPGCSRWADVCYYSSSHGMLQGVRYYSAINKANGDEIMAGVGEWFHNEILPGAVGGSSDHGWWQGWEMFWYDASIAPIHPDDAGIPLYIHLDDSEFHMYRDTWELYPAGSGDTYVYFRNSAHDGHNYWAEGYSGPSVPPDCTARTSSHDGGDNGHFGIYRNGSWLARNNIPYGGSNQHNCLTIDGKLQIMKGDGSTRGWQVPALAGTDCIGAVDSDYGHALDAIIGTAYPAGTVDNYHRYLFVIRDPMYVLVVDELEPGHTIAFNCYAESGASKQAEGLYTSSRARYELMYPQSGFTSSSGTAPIVLTTTSPQLMFLAHANPSGVSVTKSYSGGQMIATIGQDNIVYNPSGGTYSQGDISGNAKLFAERAGGALIFMATEAAGSEYGVSCSAAVNMSVSGNKASIYVYGSGTYMVTVASPFGPDTFNIEAGQTVFKEL